MAEHDRPFNSELGAKVMHELGLRPGCPQPIAGTRAMPEARTIAGDHTMLLRESVD